MSDRLLKIKESRFSEAFEIIPNIFFCCFDNERIVRNKQANNSHHWHFSSLFFFIANIIRNRVARTLTMMNIMLIKLPWDKRERCEIIGRANEWLGRKKRSKTRPL
jgi:hypothetical protein